MAKAVLIAFTSPAGPDQEDAFNEWYEKVHVVEIRKAIPSVSMVNRYRQVEVGGASAPARYVAVYEMDIDDVTDAIKSMTAALRAGEIQSTDTMDLVTSPPVLVWASGV